MTKIREKLLFEAYMLFATKTYDQVTFAELEKKVNISRGTLVYHITNKETLFAEVLKEYVFKKSSILELPISESNILCNFIKSFVNQCKEQKIKAKEIGLKNVNLAFFNIENQALFHYKSISNKTTQWLNIEKNIWQNILELSKEKGEIKTKTNTKMIANIIMETYIGNSYIGIFTADGHDINLLAEELEEIYNLIKA